MGERPEARRRRTAIRRAWEGAGRPPCPVCGTGFRPDETGKVSALWRAVVHPFCVYAKVTGQPVGGPGPDPCPLFPDCPIPAPWQKGFCVCPHHSTVNMIILARKFHQPTVKVPTFFSPGSTRAAREAGLYESYKGIPLRELPQLDVVRKHSTVEHEEGFWDRPTDISMPPDYLTVDVDRTIGAGKIIPAAEPDPDQ